MQGHDGAVDLKGVVIKNNIFKNIGDRIIRFNNVGADSQITIQYNTATDSGDDAGEVIFENCTMGCDQSSYNGLNLYLDTTIIGCKFIFLSGKTNFIDMEAAGKTLTIKNCTATLDGAAANVADYVGGSKKGDCTVTIE